jgi:hypothetical protein
MSAAVDAIMRAVREAGLEAKFARWCRPATINDRLQAAVRAPGSRSRRHMTGPASSACSGNARRSSKMRCRPPRQREWIYRTQTSRTRTE